MTQVKFFIVDQSSVLNRCVISTQYGWNRRKQERFLCYGDFSNARCIRCSPYALFFLLNEIRCCRNYRQNFGRYIRRLNGFLVIHLLPVKYEFLDKQWGAIVSQTVWEAIEVDYMVSWLSTLGGAFSALGDYDVERACIAGKISVQQLKLAIRLGDPNIVVRCYLYLSISLMQRGYFKAAKTLIAEQYNFLKKQVEPSKVLLNMCLGIWSKYKFTKKLYRQGKTIRDVVHVPPAINGEAHKGDGRLKNF